MTYANRSARSLPLWTVIGGLIAATLDIAYAISYWGITAGVPAQRILHSVASGLIGREAALAGGASTAALGLALHYLIALIMAAVYAYAATKLTWMLRRPWLSATLYGLWLFVAMNFIVVPLSRAGGGGIPKDVLWIVLSILVHVCFVAWPIAWCVGHALRPGGTARGR
ncbi:putative membrane protein [Lysobacter antibioticus]|uniref:hypothetical protein n=1 Tax=Lysobacter antibioticus TaxID=84531 RepID=UPI000717301A|nr:hypothetical protein [Lysobacter antibioticus]ALN64436.1 putative membrane protein [Lysobacter antibioticus]